MANAVVRGGRYDGVGKVFGRARAATGFSLELREILDATALTSAAATDQAQPIAAPWRDDAALRAAIAELRGRGQTVVRLPDAELGSWPGKKLVQTSGNWQIG
jgi:ATP phosphoribosyltransferase regulatory subunit